MGHRSSGFHFLFSAHGACLGPVRLPISVAAALLVVFVHTAVVAVSTFEVKHCKTGQCVSEGITAIF